MRKLLRATLLGCFALVLMAATNPSERYNELGHQMVCACGCGQILLECNHVSCPSSGPMIDELRTQIAAGGTNTSIFNWFAAKYGPTVLAAPIRGGFDRVAWIVPFAIFFLATIGTAILVRVWKLRKAGHMVLTPAAGPGNPAADALRERIRRETEY